MIRKLTPLLIVLAILLPLVKTIPVQARGNSGKTFTLGSDQLPNEFMFEQLGYTEKLLIGPYDSDVLYFSLPANVRLAPGSSLTLKYGLAWSGGGVSPDTETAGIAGTLLVYFNDQLIDTIMLSVDSPLEKEIPIPEEALNRVDATGRSSVKLFLDAEVNCEYDDLRTTVIISKNSLFNFQYEVVSPSADLALFPRPLYQPDAILQSSSLVIIPDNPEALELQSALNVMAGLGAVSDSNIHASLVTNSSLTLDMVAVNHLIFVGLAKKFPNLQAVNFPVAVSGAGLALDKDYDPDGIIEIALSPWSQASVVMFVGGNSQEGLLKASQAFSTGKFIAVEKPDVSLITTVNSVENFPVVEDQTFNGLGYEDQTLGLYDENYYSYIFYASPEQATSSGAYLDLVLSHSELLDFDETGITVFLNDEVIGGIQLSKETPVTQRLNLVPGVLRRGFNRLEIISDIRPRFDCISSDLSSTWVTISESSLIHMPVSQNKLDIGANINLNDFPYMFLDTRDISNVAFVVAKGDLISWNYASQVALFLGARGVLPSVNVNVMYADNIPDDALREYNLLVFGRASSIPFMSKLNEFLPAPFAEGTDEAVQPSMLVNYGLLPGTSVGYLQLLPSPWNLERSILVVSGNTQDGIPMAGATLLKDDLIARLSGNFAILFGDQVVSTDTRLGLSKESIVSQLPVAVTVTPVANVVTSVPQSLQVETRPAWIPPFVGAVTFGIVILIVVMMRKESSAKKKAPKEGRPREEVSSNPSSKTP